MLVAKLMTDVYQNKWLNGVFCWRIKRADTLGCL